MKGSRFFKEKTIALLLFWLFLMVWSRAFFLWSFETKERFNKETVFFPFQEEALEKLKFPLTKAGQYALDFYQAWLKEDEQALGRFFEQTLSPDKLREISAETRAKKLLALRKQLGKIIPLKMNHPSPFEFIVFFQTEKEKLWTLGLTFEEKEKKIYLQSLRVDEAEPEDLERAFSFLTLDQALEEINRQIERAVSEDRFSGVVLIAHNFKPIYFKAWGMASREFGVPNRLDTKFNLGSINKIFTKIAIGQLVEKGLLSFEDKLGQWLPDYPNEEAKEKVKIRHLIDMTSGIGDFFGPEFENTPKDFIRHNRDYLPLFAFKPLAFEPGTKQLYSNGGYVILGEIISRVSGIDYYDFIKINIFDMAGMKDTAWYEADEIVPNLADGYTREVSGKKQKVDRSQEGRLAQDSTQGERAENQKELTWRKNIYTRPARGSAAGGGYSTAEDLLKFIEALAQCRFLSLEMTNWIFGGPEPERVKQAIFPAPSPNQRRLNWNESSFEVNLKGKWNLAVAGGAPGINAVLEFEAESGWTIIVLANLDPPAATSISRLIKRYLPKNRDT